MWYLPILIPILHNFFLSSAGIILDEDSDELDLDGGDIPDEDELAEMVEDRSSDISKKSDAELEELLHEAIKQEDYERASIIRDEINKRQAN